VHSGFGPLSDDQWRHLTAHGARVRGDGKLGLAYDPKIGDAFRGGGPAGPLADVDFWPFYERVRCPTLVVRGAQSDILRPQDALAMSERGPRARVVELPGIGHAPALMTDDQIGLVRDFLLAG